MGCVVILYSSNLKPWGPSWELGRKWPSRRNCLPSWWMLLRRCVDLMHESILRTLCLLTRIHHTTTRLHSLSEVPIIDKWMATISIGILFWWCCPLESAARHLCLSCALLKVHDSSLVPEPEVIQAVARYRSEYGTMNLYGSSASCPQKKVKVEEECATDWP